MMYSTTTSSHWLAHRLPDALARIDLDTFRLILGTRSLFPPDFASIQNQPEASPRQLLKKIARRKRWGSEPMMSTEYEFFIFGKTLTGEG